MRRNGAEWRHPGLQALEEEGVFRSDLLDLWSRGQNVEVLAVTIHVIGPTGFLFSAQADYPLTKTLHLVPGAGEADVPPIRLSEFWFHGFKSFAVYDCTGRGIATYDTFHIH